MSIFHYLLGRAFFQNADTADVSQQSLDRWTAICVLLGGIGVVFGFVVLALN